MDPLVSVIVPVYNTAGYLGECLESLKEQSLKDIEIIVIDDGSTDGSGQICDSFAEEDDRFVVLHKENEGVSVARNIGLDYARGRYLMFVDSDDWVEPEFCEMPYRIAQENCADIVVFSFWKHGKGNAIEKNNPFQEEGVVSEEKIHTEYWDNIGAYPVNKLYIRRLFNGVRFPRGRRYEDIAVTHQVIHKAKSIFMINRYLYHYRDYRLGSATNTESVQNLTDYFMYSFKRLDDVKSWGYHCEDDEVLVAAKYLVFFGRHAEYSKRCNNILKDTKQLPEGRIATKKMKIMYQVYRLSPLLFDLISILTGRRFN